MSEECDSRDAKSAQKDNPADSARDALPIREAVETAGSVIDAQTKNPSDFKSCLRSIRDFEAFLRVRLQCSRAEAKIMAAQAYKALTSRGETRPERELLRDVERIMQLLRRNIDVS